MAKIIVCFAYSIITILGICFLLDRWILPALEDRGKIVCLPWKNEKNKINAFMAARNLATYKCPVWHSAGIPVTAKLSKSRRILVMGDSFVWGSGAANVNTLWWRQLQRELEKRGYKDVEVIAAGVCGAETHDELDWAKKIVPDYSPDLVIWGYVTNDCAERMPNSNNFYVKRMPLLLPDDDFSKWARRIWGPLFPNLTDQLISIRQAKRRVLISGSAIGSDDPQWELKLLKGRNFEQYQKTVEELGQFARESHIPMFVVPLPVVQPYKHHKYFQCYKYYKMRYTPIERLYGDNGILFINCLNKFMTQFVAQHAPAPHKSSSCPVYLYLSPYPTINPADGHPNCAICRFYAVQAANTIEDKFPQVLGPQSRTAAKITQTPRFNDWVLPSLAVKQIEKEAFQLQYPTCDTDMLQMPIRKPYILLSLEMPVALSRLELCGHGLQSAEIYVSSKDANSGVDDGSLYVLGKKSGSDILWSLPDEPWTATVNTICISAKVTGVDRNLVLKLTPGI